MFVKKSKQKEQGDGVFFGAKSMVQTALIFEKIFLKRNFRKIFLKNKIPFVCLIFLDSI